MKGLYRIRIECHKCHRTLGQYIGEPFRLHDESALIVSGYVKTYCKPCYDGIINKKKAPTVVMK